jgi:hypothetical protein
VAVAGTAHPGGTKPIRKEETRNGKRILRRRREAKKKVNQRYSKYYEKAKAAYDARKQAETRP